MIFPNLIPIKIESIQIIRFFLSRLLAVEIEIYGSIFKWFPRYMLTGPHLKFYGKVMMKVEQKVSLQY